SMQELLVEMPPSTEPLIRTEGLVKRFPTVVANDHISFEVRKGEIHCLLGENGAGKTTLMEILFGAYRPDEGTIYIHGKPVILTSPRDAIAHGIGMVHQHFILIPTMTVVENILIGRNQKGWRLRLNEGLLEIERLCQTYGISIDLQAKVADLSVGEQQWVEILKALYGGVELLILDEPTAVLTPQETAKLFTILKKMRDDGISIIFVTHKLKEVMAISDRVSVLRKGKLMGTVETSQTTQEELACWMVGREVELLLDKGISPIGGPILEVIKVNCKSDGKSVALRDISFTLHRGESLGLAGVSGNGQRELFDVLVGMRRSSSGQVLLDGEDITNLSPREITVRGMAFVPEDRIHQGLVMDFRVDENLILGLHRSRPFYQRPFLSYKKIEEFAKTRIYEYDIVVSSHRHPTRVLSGGNLQKVIIARELSQRPKCLIVSQPTRGLDVGATEYVRRRLLEQRDNGAGILVISEDLDEIYNLSTRIAVIYKGRLMGIVDPQKTSLEQIGLMMAGVHIEETW
ncbi:MAG: ABC transporter ATP-binding protein, partial [Anaerolineae bacterium]